MPKQTTHRPFHLYCGHTYFLTGRCYKKIPHFQSVQAKNIFCQVLNKSVKRFKIRLFAWVILHNHYHLLFALPQDVIEEEQRSGTCADFASHQSANPKENPNNAQKNREMSPTESSKFRVVCPHTNQRNSEMSPQGRISRSPTNPTPASKQTIIEFTRKLHKDTSRLRNKQENTFGRQIWYQYWDYCIRNKTDFWAHFNYIIYNPLKHKLVKNLAEAYHYQYSSNPAWLERFTIEGLSEGFIKYPVKHLTIYEE